MVIAEGEKQRWVLFLFSPDLPPPQRFFKFIYLFLLLHTIKHLHIFHRLKQNGNEQQTDPCSSIESGTTTTTCMEDVVREMRRKWMP